MSGTKGEKEEGGWGLEYNTGIGNHIMENITEMRKIYIETRRGAPKILRSAETIDRRRST